DRQAVLPPGDFRGGRAAARAAAWQPATGQYPARGAARVCAALLCAALLCAALLCAALLCATPLWAAARLRATSRLGRRPGPGPAAAAPASTRRANARASDGVRYRTAAIHHATSAGGRCPGGFG